jgi:hypothetical protein
LSAGACFALSPEKLLFFFLEAFSHKLLLSMATYFNSAG